MPLPETNPRQPGRTYAMLVTIKDADNVAIAINSIAGLAIILSLDGGRIIGQWSKVTKPNYMPMEVTGVPGQVRITLPAKNSVDLNNEQSYLEVIRQEQSGDDVLNFGLKDGKRIPIIYFTNAAVANAPSLI